MQWSGIQGGAAPFEALPDSLKPPGTAITQYNLGLKHPHIVQREIFPTSGLGNGAILLEAQEGQHKPYEPKARKAQFHSTPVIPLPENAGILRPLAEMHLTPVSRRSDHGPMLEPMYSPFLTSPPQKPLTPHTSHERVEPPHMQKEQKVWDPAPPQFMGWGAPHALPTDYTLADRKSTR
jgi:hypothetical protein